MKYKIILPLLVVLLLLPAAHAALEVSGEVAETSISAGDTFKLRITFANTENTAINSIFYEIFADSSITGYTRGKLYEFGGLNAGSSRSAEISLIAGSTATDGSHPITVKVQSSAGEVQKKFDVRIGSSAVLHISEVSLNDKLAEPGSSIPIKVTLRNFGGENIYKVRGKLNFTSSDIQPYLSGGISYVNLIKQDSSGSFEFVMSVDSGATTQTYQGLLTVTYEDNSGVEQQKEFTIGLPVSGMPSLKVLNSEIDDGQLEVEVENLGTAKAKAIRAELIQDGEIVSVDIDNELKSDKHTTLRFKEFSAGVATLRITYLDEDNVEYEETLPLTLESSAGSESSVSPIMLLLLVAVIGEAYYIYKLRKKK